MTDTENRWSAELTAARAELDNARQHLIQSATRASLLDHLDAAVDRFVAARGRVERTVRAAEEDGARE